MFFGKKKNKDKCINCSSKIESKFSFCPYCGKSQTSLEKEKKDFGLLGKVDSDTSFEQESPMGLGGFGISDKMINSLINKLMKNLGSQLNDTHNMDNTEVSNIPNGIKIKISSPNIKKKQLEQKTIPQENLITDKQIEKMSKLPRTPAKTKVKRLSNKIVYELATPGLKNKEDVFISKLESGYEIKAIGNRKMFVNNIPLSLPLKNYSLINNKLLIEFQTEDD